MTHAAPDDDEPNRITPADQDALRRALTEARRDPSCVVQLARKEREDSVLEAQLTAAYHCQVRNLKLKPWEAPPCFGDAYPGHDGHVGGAKLLRQLLDAGLSRFEPNPLSALAKVEPRDSGELPPAA